MLEIGAQKPDVVVILLHGLGADADDLLPVAQALCQLSPDTVQCCLPNAPVRSLSLYPGTQVSAWYDFVIEGVDRQVNEADLDHTVSQMTGLIEQKVQQGVEPQRIVLLGFSQGGAIAYATAMSSDRTLGGVFALSTYIPNPINRKATSCFKQTPLHIYHGTEDDVVPLSLAESSMSWLSENGVDFEYATYPMAHTISLSELRDIQRAFSVNVLTR